MSRWELPSQEPQVMLGVLQWVSGEVGARAAALSCTALLWVRQLLSSALSLPWDTSVFRISPIPEERVAPHAWTVA